MQVISFSRLSCMVHHYYVINKLNWGKALLSTYKYNFLTNRFIDVTNNDSVIIDNEKDVVRYAKDRRVIYNCVVEKYKLNIPYYVEKKLYKNILKIKKKKLYKSSVPLIVEKLNDNVENDAKILDIENNKSEFKKLIPVQFPFSKFEKYYGDNLDKSNDNLDEKNFDVPIVSVKEDVEKRLRAYESKKNIYFPQVSEQTNSDLEFRFYEDTLLKEDDLSAIKDETLEFYGSPDSTIPISSVPCGGCGAWLHCQDEAVPGYVPSEIFKSKKAAELRSLDCQRCYFLKVHKTALNIRVSPDAYENALNPVRKSRALILVVVDLLDTPCSIWPGLLELIGQKRPVVIVGNKVDLLPLDSPDYLNTIQSSLLSSVKGTSLSKANIKHLCLVSAKTGYGVESLITNLQIKWGVKGDIYILGCTNAGKSSLFNALLGSDMCKVAASSLIKRATASPWPGTTMNLLKFPLLSPTGKRLFDRMNRIIREAKTKTEQKVFGTQILPTPSNKMPTLTGHIGQTHIDLTANVQEPFDPFKFDRTKNKETIPIVGIDEKSNDYKNSPWCYDTPGTVHPDQFLAFLTHEELTKVLPKDPIKPRTFSVRNFQTILIGGLARLDLLYCTDIVRFSVCCSNDIPITIVKTNDAAELYKTYLGSPLLGLPSGSSKRLEMWPVLRPKNIFLLGHGNESCADVVLSSAGFVSISGPMDSPIDLRGWTPGGRGVHVRQPSMIPKAFNLVGRRKKKSRIHFPKEVAVAS